MGGHVLLVGMTGSGKSTVGRLVSYRLGVECIDTDEEVIRAAGRSISELFASAGEEEFRSMEARAVEEALKKSSPAVVTVGGGAILNPSSRAMVQEAGFVVWLRASVATLTERIGDAAGRPLLQGEDLVGTLARLEGERSSVYAGVAHVTVDTDGLTADEVAERVVELSLERREARVGDEGPRR